MFLKDILKYFFRKLTLYFEGIVLILRTMEFSLVLCFVWRPLENHFMNVVLGVFELLSIPFLLTGFYIIRIL